jgi:hypothetical protein
MGGVIQYGPTASSFSPFGRGGRLRGIKHGPAPRLDRKRAARCTTVQCTRRAYKLYSTGTLENRCPCVLIPTVKGSGQGAEETAATIWATPARPHSRAGRGVLLPCTRPTDPSTLPCGSPHGCDRGCDRGRPHRATSAARGLPAGLLMPP